jgi:hypothetical protein
LLTYASVRPVFECLRCLYLSSNSCNSFHIACNQFERRLSRSIEKTNSSTASLFLFLRSRQANISSSLCNRFLCYSGEICYYHECKVDVNDIIPVLLRCMLKPCVGRREWLWELWCFFLKIGWLCLEDGGYWVDGGCQPGFLFASVVGLKMP